MVSVRDSVNKAPTSVGLPDYRLWELHPLRSFVTSVFSFLKVQSVQGPN